ncbi:PID-CTERM protein-sorting domain-containing protein [Hymenobacter rubripertinctus]|uniref:VPDSG-CTERM sorting domain-containing protein n=1 Tax=Hymenobacter rubripertinctus TaxID=2029981 RepID=A0A418R720_9BACT|nr:hypothetical protein [Hymenobacter rubripertinctus]RIY13273.1 hypothetical protein D0T11_02230 [Hymenobacter rubripertinctus]
MKQLLKPFLLLALTLLLPASAALAQGPGSGGPVPDPTDPTAVPLDGGASLLLAGGVAYGLRRLRARRSARS